MIKVEEKKNCEPQLFKIHLTCRETCSAADYYIAATSKKEAKEIFRNATNSHVRISNSNIETIDGRLARVYVDIPSGRWA